jgi:hypothetical protein
MRVVGEIGASQTFAARGGGARCICNRLLDLCDRGLGGGLRPRPAVLAARTILTARTILATRPVLAAFLTRGLGTRRFTDRAGRGFGLTAGAIRGRGARSAARC